MRFLGHWQRGVMRQDRSRWGLTVQRTLLSRSEETFLWRGLVITARHGAYGHFLQTPFWRAESKAQHLRRYGADA